MNLIDRAAPRMVALTAGLARAVATRAQPVPATHSWSGCELVSVSGAGRPRHHGLAAFQASIVDGNHPRVVPISASGRVVGIDQTCRAGLDSDPLGNLCARQIPLGHCDSLPNEKAPHDGGSSVATRRSFDGPDGSSLTGRPSMWAPIAPLRAPRMAMFGPTTATAVPEAAKGDTTSTPSVTCIVPGGDRGAPRVGGAGLNHRMWVQHMRRRGALMRGAPSW